VKAASPIHNGRLPREILAQVRRIEVRTKRLVNDSLAGSYHSVFKGRGMNFDEVREYVPGDEIRAIDWNVTARTGIPHVKKFTEERELTIMLLIDISGSGDFGSAGCSKRELMAEVGSVLAFSALRNNDKVGLVLFSDEIELYTSHRKKGAATSSASFARSSIFNHGGGRRRLAYRSISPTRSSNGAVSPSSSPTSVYPATSQQNCTSCARNCRSATGATT
jgi:hypothetical protein